jgi:integrase
MSINNDVLPIIGDKQITDIQRRDLIPLFETVAARAPGQARNVYKATTKLFWYAKKNLEIIDASPCIEMLDSVPALRDSVNRERILSDKEIQKLWKRVDKWAGSDSVKRALKTILITAQRPEEVTGMHRREISQEDDGIWWTIPWERIKTENSKLLKRKIRCDHRVYLSPLALSLIGDSTGYIFPSPNGEGPIMIDSLSQRVWRGGVIDRPNRTIRFQYYGLRKWRPHDLRRTARTGMTKIGIVERPAEEVINHKKEKIVSTYDLHKYDREKKEALTKWAEYLEALLASDKRPKHEVKWRKLRGGAPSFKIEKVRELIKEKGGILLTTEYENNQQDLLIRCNCGREFTSDLRHIQMGRWCQHSNRGRKITFELIKGIVEDRGGQILTDKESFAVLSVPVRCFCGREWTPSSYSLTHGKWCPAKHRKAVGSK